VCTINESDLTGESTLVMKTYLPNDIREFVYEYNKKSVLFHGTRINKCESNLNDGEIRALAINTGFNTNRGNLIQNLLFPKPTNFKFYHDVKIFLYVMTIIWILVCIFLVMLYLRSQSKEESERLSILEITNKAFDLLTVIIPPILPICMTFTTFYFHYNLGKKKISCISDKRMNAAGRVNNIILDKTGTLTEEGLDLEGFQTSRDFMDRTHNLNLNFDRLEMNSKIFNAVHKEFYKRLCLNPDEECFTNYQTNPRNNLIYFLECLATCHAIDKVKGDSLGNSIDKKIFDNIKWSQEKCEDFWTENIKYDMIPKKSFKITGELVFRKEKNRLSGKRYKLTIIKRFEFSSKFQSMSVIVKNCLDDSYRFFIKGAPERIIQLCNPTSLPCSYNDMLMEHTKNGYRVLACATKFLEGNNESKYSKEEERSKYENDLTFLGFIIFRNKLKRDTKHVIAGLKNSDCKLVMATGDNPFTSISVARECELIESEKEIYLIDLEKEVNSDLERIKM
jgi:cation-transporting ATPase 13A2